MTQWNVKETKKNYLSTQQVAKRVKKALNLRNKKLIKNPLDPIIQHKWLSKNTQTEKDENLGYSIGKTTLSNLKYYGNKILVII